MKTKLFIFFLSAFFASWQLGKAQQSIPYWRFSTAINTTGATVITPPTGLVALGTTGDWEASFNGSPFVPALHVSDVIPNPPYWWTWNPELVAAQNSYGWVSYPFQTPPNDPRIHSSQGQVDIMYRIKFFLPANPLLTVDLDIYGDDFVVDVSVNGNVTTYPTPPTGQTGQNGNLNVPVKLISSTNWIPNDTNTIKVHCTSSGGHAGLMVRSNVKNVVATGIPVTLSDKNVIVLNQNVPNPFAESTVITYNVPSDFGSAQILFATTDGKVIKSIDITQKGPGTLNVFANELSHGMYTYSLIVDGKIIESKKMIKE